MTQEAKKYLTPKAGGWEAEFAGIYCEKGKRGTAFYANFSTDCGEGKVWVREYLSPSDKYGFKYVAKFVNQIGLSIGSEELSYMTEDKLRNIYDSADYQFKFVSDPVFIIVENVDWNGKTFKKITSVAPYGEYPELKSKSANYKQAIEEPNTTRVVLDEINEDDVPF